MEALSINKPVITTSMLISALLGFLIWLIKPARIWLALVGLAGWINRRRTHLLWTVVCLLLAVAIHFWVIATYGSSFFFE